MVDVCVCFAGKGEGGGLDVKGEKEDLCGGAERGSVYLEIR